MSPPAILGRPSRSGGGRWWALLGIAALFSACSPPENDSPSQTIRGLEIGPKAGEDKFFECPLARGQYLRVVANSDQIDLKLILWGPRQPTHPPSEICAKGVEHDDSMTPQMLVCSDGSQLRGPHAKEEAAWIARVPGRYQVQVLDLSAEKGAFSFERWGPREPDVWDRRRSRALAIHDEAERKTGGLGLADWHRRASLLDRGIIFWHDLGDVEREADLLKYRGDLHQKFSHFEIAESDFSRAQALYRKIGQPLGVAEASHNKGFALQNLGRDTEAVPEFQRAAELFHKTGVRENEGAALANLGNSQIALGDQHTAIASLERARDIERVVNRERLAKILNSLGEVYNSINQKEKSRDAYEQSLTLAEQYKNFEDLSAAHNGLGVYFQSIGDWDRAIENYRRALDELPENRVNWRARTYNNLGRAYTWQNKIDRAQDSFRQALKILGTIDAEARDPETEAYVLTNLAFLYLKTKQFGLARDLIKSARRMKHSNDQFDIASREVEGALYRELGNFYQAREALERGLTLSQKLDYPQRTAGLLLELARLNGAENHLGVALEKIEQAIQIIESSRNQLLDKEQRSTLQASRNDFYDFYVDLLEQSHKADPTAGYDGLALKISERAHARSLLEALNEVDLDPGDGADRALPQRGPALREKVQGAELRLSALRQRRAKATEVQDATQRLKASLAELSRFEDRQRGANPRYAELVQPEPLTADQMKQVAGSDALILEYWLGEERSHLWVISAEGISSFAIAQTRQAIEDRASSFYEALVEPGRPQSTAASRRQAAARGRQSGDWLSRTLLGPAASLLKSRPLLIVADGALHHIPFSALPDPLAGSGSMPKILLEMHPLVNLPSVSVLRMLRNDRGAAPPKEAAIYGDPVFRDDDPRVGREVRQPRTPEDSPGDARGATISSYSRLTNTRKEAETIYRLLGGPRSCRLRLDFDASVDDVKKHDLSQYRIVHFATHGDVNSETPGLSALVLSLVDREGRPQEGFLRLHDIYNLKLRADLVVLSACRTALGRDIRGEGLVGLTRGFMYAGAKRVLASLWSVDSVATEKLMEKFYRHMAQEHLSAARALQRAKMEMSKDRTWHDPYYWAGFTLQGEWQ